MKRPFKKLTAWLCCMAMLISFIPATALPVFADEAEPVELTQELAASALASGEYYLSGDLALTGTLTIAKNTEVVIDLAGNDITGTVYPLINVGGKLTVTDSAATGTPGTDYVSGAIVGGENASNANYGMIYVSGGPFTLDGGKLTGYNSTTTSARGGAVATIGGTIVMNGGEITGNTATYGAGVFVTGAGTFTMTGGAIYGNTATAAGVAAGGGVFGEQSAVINIEGGVIKNNTAERGSEIALKEVATPTLNISGGTITTSGTGTYDGVYSQNPTLNVSGGTIDRIYWRAGAATISGGTIGRFANANDNLLTITGNPTIGELAASGSVTGSTIGPLTEGADITYSSVGKLTVVHATVARDTTAKTFTYQVPVLPTSSSLLAGDYVLTGAHVLTNTLTIPAGVEVSIDLAGHTISMPDTDATYFSIAAGGKLTIKDSSSGNGKIQAKENTSGNPVFNLEGELVLNGGTITGWIRNGAGAVINMKANSTFKMTGGSITGNSSTSYTIIRPWDGGQTIEITGGSITNNESGNYIVALNATADNPATVTIGGDANISGNTIGGVAYTPKSHELSFTNAHVSVGGTATVGTLYTNGDAETEGVDGFPYSSMTFTGAPVVQSVRWSSGTNTPVRIEGLTEGASIKTGSGQAITDVDGSVTSEAYGDAETNADDRAYGTHYYYEDPNKGNLPTSGEVEPGTYTLTKDVALEDTLIVKGEVIIDLAGFDITGTVYPLIKTSGNSADLIIKDSTATGTPGVDYVSGAIVGGENTDASDYGMINGSGGIITLESGKLTGYNQTTSGGNRGTVGMLAGTFNMTGGEISGNTVAKGGGGVMVTSSAVFNMSGGAITGNTATTNGGGVCLEGTGTFNMTGGTISGNTAGDYGAGVYTQSTAANSVNISGGTISGNTTADNGGGLYVKNGASATVSGNAVISGNTAKLGGGVYNAGTVSITGGTFQNNSATSYGGALYLDNNSKLTGVTATVTGGTFTGNSAVRGGGISTYEGGTAGVDYIVKLTIGGTAVIEGNEATSGGANLYLQPADLTITGGTIGTGTKAGAVVEKSSSGNNWIRNNAENTTTVTGGNINGLYVDKGTVNVSGNPVIGEIYVTNTTINMSGLTNGAKIRTGGLGLVTVGDESVYTTNDRDYLCADDVYDVTVEQVTGGTITVSPTAGVVGTKVTVTVEVNDGYQLTGILLDGNVLDGTSFTISKDHTVTATFAEVEAGVLPSSGPVAAGEYTLAEDVTLSGTLTVAGVVTIDLAGYTLTGAVAPYFEVTTGGTLIITDSSEGQTGKVVGLATADNGMIYVNGGAFELQGGTLTGHTSTAYGGAVAVKAYTNSSVTISGGTITGNTAPRGGGISMGDGGSGVTLTVTGGTITGNTSTAYGQGDIYSHSGTYNISGGHIGGATLRYGTTNVTGAPRIDLLDCTDNAVASNIGALTEGARIVTKAPDALTVTEDGSVFHEPITSFYRHTSGTEEETSILVIGNSFGGDTISYLKKIGAKYDILVGASNMYIGSQNFRWHALSLAESLGNKDLNGDGTIGDARATKYDGYDEETGRYEEGLYAVDGYEGHVDIPTVLDGDKDWDYIVLQNGVEYVGFDGTYNNDVQFLIDYINDVQPNAKIYFNQTWATDDSTTSGKNYMTQFGGSQEAMYNAILRNTEEFTTGRFAEQVEGYFPIGTAIQEMRGAYTATALTRDGYHLSLNAGRMIAGLTVMKTLFDIDLDALTAADVVAMFDYGVGAETTSSTDAFDYNVEANVTALLDSVKTACGYAAADEVAPYGDGSANKQFNPDAAMNGSTEYVAVYENVTEVGQAYVIEEGAILPDAFGTAGAGKIVIYEGGVEVGSIDEQWLDEQIADIELTNRLQKVKNGDEYYIFVDPQAPQLATDGSTLYMTFNLMGYTETYTENIGVYLTTSTDGATWTTPVLVSDVMGYGLTYVDGNLMLSVTGETVDGDTKIATTNVLTMTTAGVEVSEVELTTDIFDVAFAKVGDNIYALASNGVLYVSDDGASWTDTGVDTGAGASPDMVTIQESASKGWYSVYITWADEANQDVYGKIWTIDAADASYGWNDTEAFVLVDGYTLPTGYSGKTTGGQPATYLVATTSSRATVKTVYTDGGVQKATSNHGIIITANNNMDLGASLLVNFMFLKTEVEALGVEKVVVTVSNPAADMVPYEVEWATSADSMYGTTLYQYSVPIAAKQMGDKLVAVAYDAEGRPVSFAEPYSARTYIDNQLAKDTYINPTTAKNEYFRTLLIDLLNYGAAAQTQFTYATDALVNAHLTETQQSWASDELVVGENLTNKSEVNAVGVTINKSLYLEDVIQIAVLWPNTTITEAATAKVSYVTHGDTVADNKEFPIVDSTNYKGYKEVLINTLGTADVYTKIACQLYDAEGNPIDGAYIEYSIETYCYNQISKARPVGTLCMKLMQAGRSAYNYQHPTTPLP